MAKKKAAVRKRKTVARPRGGVKLGQMRRAAEAQLQKVQDALKTGRVSNKTKARKLVSQLRNVMKMAKDECPFEIQFDPTAS